MISATMPAGPSTLADLRKAGIITSQEIVAAIDLYLRDPAAGSYRFASGHSLDIAALVNASFHSREEFPAQHMLSSTRWWIWTATMAESRSRCRSSRRYPGQADQLQF
ncbi:hypothetical protein [Methylobacterium sp. GC_Met_2]|uniref:hypothetical protein n=1 Tax=Methylobacterium sp. GC_Met_2 TaxID=2937376 RepID=UPI00226B0A1B|nr:hypothetical protein [Methylobacterium sp. GC_Met_2]